MQKFVKSQLRAKKYQLKLTEVYPVPSETIVIPGEICGLERRRGREPQNHFCTTDRIRSQQWTTYSMQLVRWQRTILLHPRTRKVVRKGILGGYTSWGEQSVAEVRDNNPTVPAVPSAPPRLSKRQVTQPAWMRSGL